MFFCFVDFYGQFYVLAVLVLLFGVQWFCCHFKVERCVEMEFVQTCSSKSYFNVSFAYVGVHAVYAVLNFCAK
jgi:hypothetical protein